MITLWKSYCLAITIYIYHVCGYLNTTSANPEIYPWWRHQMETFSALLALCAGNSPVTGEFPAKRPVTRSFDVFFDLRLNKRLSKQSWGWWFETLSRPLWRHRNAMKESHETATGYDINIIKRSIKEPSWYFMGCTLLNLKSNIKANYVVSCKKMGIVIIYKHGHLGK